MRAALSGTRIERNTIISRRNDIATTAAMKSGSRSVMRSVRSVTIAWPVSDTLRVGAGDGGGQDVGAEVADELVGALVLRCGGRVDGEHGGVAGGVEDRGGHRGDAGVGLQRVVDPLDRSPGPPDVGSSTTTWIGPLNPGPKPAASWS